MNFNPNLLSKHAILLIQNKDPFFKKIISEWESDGKSITCFNGIRPTIPSTQFPSFEIEVSNVDTEWATTRSQRHHVTFRCMVTVSAASNIDVREDYITKIASSVVSVLNSPSTMRFSLYDKSITDADYRIDCYDSMVSSCSYNSTRDGTIGVAEFSWTCHCDEIINDGEFYIQTGKTSGMIAPFQKKSV